MNAKRAAISVLLLSCIKCNCNVQTFALEFVELFIYDPSVDMFAYILFSVHYQSFSIYCRWNNNKFLFTIYQFYHNVENLAGSTWFSRKLYSNGVCIRLSRKLASNLNNFDLFFYLPVFFTILLFFLECRRNNFVFVSFCTLVSPTNFKLLRI